MTSSSRMTTSSSPSNLHFGAAVLAEEDLVADLDVERTDLAVLENLAFADRYDLSLHGLFGRGIGNHDAARRGSFLLQALHDDAVMKRTYLHGCRSLEAVELIGKITTQEVC